MGDGTHWNGAWWREAVAVFAKDWRCELRSRHALDAIGLFAFTTVVVASMALGPLGTSPPARVVLPVLLWLILLFAVMAGLPRTFVHEEESGTATALRLAARPSAVFVGKALYNLTLLLALEAVVVPLFLAMLQLPVAQPGRFVVVLVAGAYGLALGSTLIAAMVGQTRVRGPLFAVLAFPVLLPLLRLAVLLTQGAVLGEPGGGALVQVLLYDGVVTVASLMLFPSIWNP